MHYHAFLREKLGKDSELLALSSATAGGVIGAFHQAHPEFSRLSHSLNIAVNEEIVSLDSPVNSGARIDLLPPYGGG